MTVPLDQLDYETLAAVMTAEATGYHDMAAWFRQTAGVVDGVQGDAAATLRRLPDAMTGAAADALNEQVDGDLASLRAVTDRAELYRIGVDLQRLASEIYNAHFRLEHMGPFPSARFWEVWPLRLLLKQQLDEQARAIVRPLVPMYQDLTDRLNALAAFPLPPEPPGA